MRLEQLSTNYFRNLTPTSLAFPSTFNLFVGDNGQGKTNLLEAIYLCATGRSFRQALPRDMLQFGQEEGRLSAILAREHVRHEVRIGLTPKSRLIRVDERPVRRLSRLFELINMVSFFPEDLSVAKGPPEGRRRFFDRAVASLNSGFVEVAIEYQKALKQRNALLRATHGLDLAVLRSFDQPLIKMGAQMHQHRLDALQVLAPLATRIFEQLCPGEVLNLSLRDGLEHPQPVADAPGYTEAFRDRLRENTARDRARGTTSFGPHRSDLYCTMNDQDTRRFASQGQQRALVLALKLAELRAASKRLGSPPLLLLDDVSSELDKERTERLFHEVSALGCQTFMTTTGATQLPTVADMTAFRVIAGVARLVS